MVNIFLKKYPAFKNRVYVRFTASQFLSLSGGFIQNVALSSLISEQNGGRFSLGLFLCLCYLPVFILSYPASKLIIKIPVKPILLITEACLFAMSAFLLFFKDMPFWGFLIFGAVWGTVRAFQTPAAASVAKLVCNEDELDSGVAALSLAQSLARAAGPILSGVLYSALGYGAAFAANAVSYIPSFILLCTLKIPRPKVQKENKKAKINLSIFLILTVFIISFCGTAYNLVFTGVSEKLALSRIWFSVFMAFIGIGAAIGAYILSGKKQLLFACTGIPFCLAMLVFAKGYITVSLIAVLYGIFDYLFFTSALRKINADNDSASLARAMGVYTAVTTGALPLGFLILGWILSAFGIDTTLWFCAAVTAAGCLLIFSKIC